MKQNKILTELCMIFFVSTACVGIAMGIIGSVFRPEERFGYNAFFSPPIFGAVAALLSLIQYSSKELTDRQLRIRQVLHFLGIEGLVLGINVLNGANYNLWLWIVLALSVSVIYILVALVLWLNDRRYAKEFNLYLKEFQERMLESE